jgi:ribosome-binding protein aMBF1 (putative translation factor)
MPTFQEHLAEQMKDPEFKEAWDELQPRSNFGMEVLRTRLAQNLEYEELAEKAGVRPYIIERIENARGEVKLSDAQKVAKALGKKLKITLEF